MRTIWAIYRADLRRVYRSLIASIVIFGLVIILSLFTWSNMTASRDLLGNTKSLRITIVNTDAGYKSDLVPPRINIGDPAVSALCKSDNFDWVIDSEGATIEGMRLSEYYMAITISSDFSCETLVFFDGGASSAPMTYYANEGKNGISPKIASQGAEATSAQMDQVFAQTLSEVTLDTATSVGGALSMPTAVSTAMALDNQVQIVVSRLRTAVDNAGVHASLIGSSVTLIDLTAALVGGLGNVKGLTQSAVLSAQAGANGLESAAPAAVSSVLGVVSSSQSSLSFLSSAVESVYMNDSTSTSGAASTPRSQASVLNTQVTSFTPIKTTFEALSSSPVSQSSLDRLQGASGRLTKVASGLRAATSELGSKTANVEAGHVGVDGLIARAHSAVDGLSSDYETDLRPQLELLASVLALAQPSPSAARTSLGDATFTASDDSGSAREGLTQLCDNLTGAATGLREATGKLDSPYASISEALANSDLTTLGTIIGNNPKALAATITAPVGVEEIPVYPVANFGPQMASLHTIPVLWVGSILMVVSLCSGVTDSSITEGLPEGHPLHTALIAKPASPVAGYPGRYLISGTTILMQATLVGLGDLYFLKVQHTHLLRFMGTLWLTVVMLSFLPYTLIATFGNAGRALDALLLALQTSDTGGAFPLTVPPSFSSSISPFLLTTHATTALRASIAGHMEHEYADAMWSLAPFILFVVFPGPALHPPLVCKNHRMMEELKSTKLF